MWHGVASGAGNFCPTFEVNIDTKTTKVSNENVEGSWRVSFLDALAGDDSVERSGAAQDVVRFDRKNFTERICGSVSEEGPDFHFTDALTAVLCFTTKRLLRRKAVWPDRAHVNLVFHHVV